VGEAFLAGLRQPKSRKLQDRLASGPGASRPPSFKLQHLVVLARGGSLDAEIRRMAELRDSPDAQRVLGLVLARRILMGEAVGPDAKDARLLKIPGGPWVLAAARATLEGEAELSGKDPESVLQRKALRGELTNVALARLVEERLLEAAVTPDGYRKRLLRELRTDLLCGGSDFLLSKRGFSDVPPGEKPYLPDGVPGSRTEYFRVLPGLLQRL
jgi:hypothetical protein